MFYCVTSIYRAGGMVSRDVHIIHSPIKPKDSEIEQTYKVVVCKYFDDESSAMAYLKKVNS